MTAPPNGPYRPQDWPPAASDDTEPTEAPEPAGEQGATVRPGPAGEQATTIHLDPPDEHGSTVDFGAAGEQGTVRLGAVDEQGSTVRFGAVEEQGTVRLDPPDEQGTVRLGPADGRGATVRLGAGGVPGVPVRLGSGDEPGVTVDPGPADEHGPTVRLDGPVGGRPPGGEPASDDAAYSATVLASHWIQRPESGDTLVEEFPTRPAAEPATMLFTVPEAGAEPGVGPGPGATPPDRVEGTLLRFGPGVTPEVAHRTHRTLPVVPPVPVPRRRRLRRHALPALVLLCVLALLAWQRLGPSVRVRTVAATVEPKVLGCDGTADIVGLVRTNGRPGTLTYRWIRSDGTSSGVLREVLVRDQRQARLHLRWTFQGKGRQEARAQLRILSPSRRTVSVPVTYACS
ncbi:hypothetical protein P1P68_11060 [Streptomyces scabiei]|uniref:hypothetical protein n=1 Tax=Streptomyces scabiei TaxID=1930 RepID=UPI00298F8BCC|nr:hypothetical protein [Streptomyces scabiei]MDW8805305.1 hypothetical protein [Streptomyces scabiei]